MLTLQTSFVPVLVRSGYANREGLAMHAARAAWESAQRLDGDARLRWMAQGCPTQVRSAHLPQFQYLSRYWPGSSTAIAGPLGVYANAHPYFQRSKLRGWQPWGTVGPKDQPTVVVVNSRLGLDHAEFCAVAAMVLNLDDTYVGQPFTVEERPVSGLGEVWLR